MLSSRPSAGVAKSVDATDLKSVGPEGRAGSSPAPGTFLPIHMQASAPGRGDVEDDAPGAAALASPDACVVALFGGLLRALGHQGVSPVCVAQIAGGCDVRL